MNIIRILADPGITKGLPREILSICPMELRFVKNNPKNLQRCLEALEAEIAKKLKPGDKLAWRWETWGFQVNSTKPLNEFCKSIIDLIVDGTKL